MMNCRSATACLAALGLSLFCSVPLIGALIEPTNKYGDCDGAVAQPSEKCNGQQGNCYGPPLGQCYNYGSLTCPGNGGANTRSGKQTQSKQYGLCGSGTSTDSCNKCAWFYCAQANLWAAANCPKDVAPACAVAVGRANSCNPN